MSPTSTTLTESPVARDQAAPLVSEAGQVAAGGSSRVRTVAAYSAAAVGVAAAAYAAYVSMTWRQYGRRPRVPADSDRLLDRFMPVYDVVERHAIRVEAPAAVTLGAATRMEAFQLPLVRAVIRGRELMLGAHADDRPRPRGLLAEAQAMGWGVLAEEPGRVVVVGAVTKPWEPQVTFRPLPPEAFAAFDEPGFVKIAWTLRADAIDARRSMFRSETRAVATDAAARARFRRYWAIFSPGIKVIRRLVLRKLKSIAERHHEPAANVSSGAPTSSVMTR